MEYKNSEVSGAVHVTHLGEYLLSLHKVLG